MFSVQDGIEFGGGEGYLALWRRPVRGVDIELKAAFVWEKKTCSMWKESDENENVHEDGMMRNSPKLYSKDCQYKPLTDEFDPYMKVL